MQLKVEAMQLKVDMQSNIGKEDQQRARYMFHFFPLLFFSLLLLSPIPWGRNLSHIDIGPLLTWLLAPSFQE